MSQNPASCALVTGVRKRDNAQRASTSGGAKKLNGVCLCSVKIPLEFCCDCNRSWWPG